MARHDSEEGCGRIRDARCSDGLRDIILCESFASCLLYTSPHHHFELVRGD